MPRGDWVSDVFDSLVHEDAWRWMRTQQRRHEADLDVERIPEIFIKAFDYSEWKELNQSFREAQGA